MPPSFARMLRPALSVGIVLALACGGREVIKETGTSTGTTTSTGTSTGTSSSTGSSDSGNSEGGFVDSSSSSGGGSTGPACSERAMCQSLGDCELGDCVDCMCEFDYGPCEGGKCTCFVPSVAVCVPGGCFCALPCNPDEGNACPVAPTGTAAPVCAEEEIAGNCGLPCSGAGEPGCPDDMTCVARPRDQPAWGDFVCVFPD